MADARKIDPFDVEALEKSLNDSATRVSTIWVSFLIFALYLLTAATTVTHRQLFLAEPVKLPVLNIDLPLWGFFFLAPILFVILHAYVLMQVILLGRTAAAYNAAIATAANNLSPEEDTSLRQRLANTLFAQIFAGAPREREGALGWLLSAMAWITLAIAPILILLTFQFAFLPYHSHGVTWTHRLLILLEFVVALQLWPLVLDPQRDVRWPGWRALLGDVVVRFSSALRSGRRSIRIREGLRRHAIPLHAGTAFILLSLWFASFPGEWHINIVTGQRYDAVQCARWLHQDLGLVDLRIDRLSLPRVDIVDDDKLEKIVKATEKSGQQPYEGERIRTLSGRDLNCGDFSGFADLRRVDLSGARLTNANMSFAKLQGASLEGAYLQRAGLDNANLQGAGLSGAKLHGAILFHANLQRASLVAAKLQGASIFNAELQGASLLGAELQAANLSGAKLQGASLSLASLQGASLLGANLQGASLLGARLQGAYLLVAELQGADLRGAHLHGADLNGAKFAFALLSDVRIWRSRNADCAGARVLNPIFRGEFADFFGRPTTATPDTIRKHVADWMEAVPEGDEKAEATERLRALTIDTANDDTVALADVWQQCAEASSKVGEDDFAAARVASIRDFVCASLEDGPTVSAGLAQNFAEDARPDFSRKLARALLGEDGKDCVPAKHYDENTRRRLRTAIAAAGQPAAPTQPLDK